MIPKLEGNQCARLDAKLENVYCKELLSHSSRRRGPVEISELPQKCCGRPLLLRDKLEMEVKCLLHHALNIAN